MKHVTRILLSSIIAAASLVCRAQPSDGATNDARPATHDVQFHNGDISLSGTLLLPSKMIAGVVLVHGSGKEPRNIQFAEALARCGIATLTYDKRGVAKSGGVYAGPEVGTNNVGPQNLDLLAGDASAAVRELVRQIPPMRRPVGLIGVSQAGWISPLAAARTREVNFMILWSGPLVTTLEQLRFQYLTDGNADFWDHHSEAEAREHIRSDPDRYSFVATDPVDSLRKLSLPGLWLYGGRDVSVPTGLSVGSDSVSISRDLEEAQQPVFADASFDEVRGALTAGDSLFRLLQLDVLQRYNDLRNPEPRGVFIHGLHVGHPLRVVIIATRLHVCPVKASDVDSGYTHRRWGFEIYDICGGLRVQFLSTPVDVRHRNTRCHCQASRRPFPRARGGAQSYASGSWRAVSSVAGVNPTQNKKK
jgi:fermentation-respiration switch protein FrsA (DUF1100 family)